MPFLFLIVACSQLTSVNCDPHSWHGLGVRDGEKGLLPRVADEYERRCRHQSVEFDRYAYEAGLRQGNAQYCTGKNGFHLALSGIETKKSCVGEDAIAFTEGLKTGHKLRKAVLDLDQSKFPTKHDLGGFTIAETSSQILWQVMVDYEGNDVWVPVMLAPRDPRGNDKRIKRSVKSVVLIARCEEAKQNAEEKGLYTSLNCSPF